jgi:hypothetical protein
MLNANNLNGDDHEWARLDEFYDPILYRIGIQYLTKGEINSDDYEELNVLQKNTVAWLKRVLKKIEVGSGTEVDE